MALIATEYEVSCDVRGCENMSVNNLAGLNRQGWMMCLIYDGKPVAYAINPHVNSTGYVCPHCVKDGSFKTMEKMRDDPPVVAMKQCPHCIGQKTEKKDGLTVRPCSTCKGTGEVPVDVVA